MKSFEYTLAWRYLFSRRREKMLSVMGGFSLIGIALGVAALIVVMSVMNGFHTALLRSLLQFNGHVEIFTPFKKGFFPEPLFLASLERDPDVVSVVPLIAGEAMMISADRAKGMAVRGIDFKRAHHFPFLRTAQVEGHLPIAPEDILLGVGAQIRLGLNLGDAVKLIASEGQHTPFGIIPRVRHFRICGFFSVGMTEYENNVAFLSLESAQMFYRLDHQVTQVEIFLRNPEKAVEKSNTLHLLSGLYVLPWQKTQGPLANALIVERNVMFIILSLIILVAVFNITSSLVMLVKDKIGDIAILQTMGASPSQIMRLFLNVGMATGCFGVGIGFAIGIPIALYLEKIRQWLEHMFDTKLFDRTVYFLTELPCELRFYDLGGLALLTLLLSLSASLYPAWRASRVDPITGLHHV